VEVSAEHPSIRRNRAVVAFGQLNHGARQARAGADAGMDFITLDGRTFQGQMAADAVQLFFRAQFGFDCQQAQAGAAAGHALDAQGIMDRLSQHLETAADADHLAAIAQVAQQRGFPAAGAQPLQVGAHVLAAGQDDQVGRGNSFAHADKLQIHVGMQAQGVEIGVIADARQARHDDAEFFSGESRHGPGQRVLGFQVKIVEIGQHAQHRLAATRLQPVQTGFQQANIAAKTVDDEALDPCLLGPGQQFQRAHQMGEHAAAVDVGNDHHRAVGGFGEAHVGDVAVAQVDFRRAARPFHHDEIVGLLQPREGFQHLAQQARLVAVVIPRLQVADGVALDDDLGAGIAVGLEQHRVHVAVRREAAGLRLHRLGAADFAAVHGHGAVERHVLRLERRHTETAPGKDAADARHQRALAGVRGAALNHQYFAAHGKLLNAFSNRRHSSSCPGRPKRRLGGDSQRRSQIPCCASFSWIAAARSVLTHWNSALPPHGGRP
jgi:hypothetical protein